MSIAICPGEWVTKVLPETSAVISVVVPLKGLLLDKDMIRDLRHLVPIQLVYLPLLKFRKAFANGSVRSR